MFWMHSDDLPTAAHIWAAAAGTAGALAPRHIAGALMEGHTLFYAAIEGTRRANQEVGEDWPSPRGCEIVVERGTASLSWRTERHQILLSEESTDRWSVAIHCRHDGGSCERVRVAEAARGLWEKHKGRLLQAPSAVRGELAHAATMVTRMLGSGEIFPDVDIASCAGLHALWGVLWAWEKDEAQRLVESMLGYIPSIGTPHEGDPAGIVIDTPFGRRVGLGGAPVALWPTDTMAVIISGRLRDLGRPEFVPTIHALGVVAGIEIDDLPEQHPAPIVAVVERASA